MERLYIGVAGVSEEPSPKLISNAKEFIDKLAEFRDEIVFLIGGYWGFMKYFADQAMGEGFTVVFILPDNPPIMPPNNDKTVIIQTDLGFPTRSTVMCRSSDVLVVFGGRIGSMIEALLGYDFNRPVLIIESGYETDDLCKCFQGYFDRRRKAPLYCLKSVEEAVEKIREFIEKKRVSQTII